MTKNILFLMLIVIANTAIANTVYVSDRISLGLTELPQGGQDAILRLKNGTKLEAIEKQGSYTKVKLEDGTEGWLRSYFISDIVPASVKIISVEKENQKLKLQVAALQDQIKLSGEQQISPNELFQINQEKMALQTRIDEAKANSTRNIVISIVLSLFTLIIGFILGYSVLEKRIKTKFNGMKVW